MGSSKGKKDLLIFSIITMLLLCISSENLHGNSQIIAQYKRKLKNHQGRIQNIVLSKTGNRAAVVYIKDKDIHIQIEDTLYGSYSEIGGLSFSNTGKTFAFWHKKPTTLQHGYNFCILPFVKGYLFAKSCFTSGIFGGDRREKVNSHYLQIGEKTFGGFKYMVNTDYLHDPKGRYTYTYNKIYTFDKNSEKFAFAYGEGEKINVNINNRLYGPYKFSEFEMASTSYIKFSKDLQNFGFIHISINKKNGISEYFHHAQVRDTHFGPYDHVSSFSIGPKNSYCFIYKKGNQYYAKINNKDIGPYYSGPHNHIKRLILSEDGNSFLIWYRDKDNDYIRINNKINGPLHGITKVRGSKLFCNRRLSKYAIRYLKNNKHYLSIDGKTFGPADNIKIHYSDHGGRYAVYQRIVNGKTLKDYIHIHNKKYGPFKSIDFKYFSKNGKRFGFIFKSNKKYFIQTEKKVIGPFDKIHNLTVSNDGSWYGVVYTDFGEKSSKANTMVQVGTRKHGPYYSVKEVIFSPDGSRFSYLFSPPYKYNKTHLQIDNKSYNIQYQTVTLPVFTRKNRVRIAFNNDEFIYIEEYK